MEPKRERGENIQWNPFHIFGLLTFHSALGHFLLDWSLLKLRVQGAPFCLLARKLQRKRSLQEKEH